MEIRIKQARERLGISQKELASKLRINPSTFNGYETGAHDPKSFVLAEIALACNTTADFLLGLTDDPEVAPTSATEAEEHLLQKFQQLNPEGQEKVLSYTDDLVQSGRYKKNNQPQLVQKA